MHTSRLPARGTAQPTAASVPAWVGRPPPVAALRLQRSAALGCAHRRCRRLQPVVTAVSAAEEQTASGNRSLPGEMVLAGCGPLVGAAAAEPADGCGPTAAWVLTAAGQPLWPLLRLQNSTRPSNGCLRRQRERSAAPARVGCGAGRWKKLRCGHYPWHRAACHRFAARALQSGYAMFARRSAMSVLRAQRHAGGSGAVRGRTGAGL
jgi:hypothetical protein